MIKNTKKLKTLARPLGKASWNHWTLFSTEMINKQNAMENALDPLTPYLFKWGI